MTTCNVCKTEYGEGDTVYMGQCVHRPNRCRDVLAARVAELDKALTVALADEEVRAERATHDLTRARLEATERALIWALRVLDDGHIPKAPDHLCGPESACDSDCSDFAYYVADKRKARAALDAPALPAAAPARAGAVEWEDCPACEGTGRSCPARLDACAICGGSGELRSAKPVARLDPEGTAKGKTILTAEAVGRNGPMLWPGPASTHVDTETGKRTPLGPVKP